MIRNISNLHLEILDNKRKKLFTKLISLSKGFVLGGGTALSLQVGHRISFDFDFFGTLPLNKKLLESLTKSFSIESVVVDSTDELTFFTDGVKVTFIYYPFRPIFEIRKLDDGLSIYQVKEIAIQKAYTIGRRGEYRDYFDLYTILSGGHINFDEIINKAKKCYGGAFDEKLFLEQLTFFDDLTSFEIISIEGGEIPDSDEVKAFFEKLTVEYLSKK